MKGDELRLDPEKIQLIVYDFDGVMTDNKVILREDGLESVVVNRSDGLAVEIIKGMGIEQVILSKEKNKVVTARAKKLGISVIQGVDNKKELLLSHFSEKGIDPENVVYIGNDINDVEPMSIVGYPICPFDAYKEAKELSKIILSTKGGDGVIRDFFSYLKKN